MTAYQKLEDEIAYGFRKNHGRAGVYIVKPVSPIGCIIKLLKLFIQYDANRNICIVVDDDNTANNIRDICDNTFKTKIDIISKVYKFIAINNNYDLVITLNIDDLDYLNKIISTDVKFYLFIFNHNNIKDKDYIKRNSLVTFINTTVSVDAIVEDSIYSPVKEWMIPVDLSDDSRKEYDKTDKYIADSMKIFGCFEVLDRCRAGNKNLNISPIKVCNQVAANNGWSYDLDTTTEFGQQVDSIYNPNALYERACLSYTIMKKRRDIVTDANEKIAKVCDIVMDNIDKKILIVSARGEFAYELSKHINTMLHYENTDRYKIICGNYHDAIPDTVEIDVCGNPVLVKSGANKGKERIIGHQKQSTNAERDFNTENINVLSIKFNSNPKLCIDADIVIFTTPLMGTIFDIKRRYRNIYFRTNPFEVYTLYCDNTIENIKIDKIESTFTHEIIKEDENIFISE